MRSRLRAGLPKSWRVGDKTGNNGKDAFGDIAVTWSAHCEPVLICAYTQGGAPTPRQVEAVFTEIGRLVGMHLSSAVCGDPDASEPQLPVDSARSRSIAIIQLLTRHT
jgi:beta-lactamase class A